MAASNAKSTMTLTRQPVSLKSLGRMVTLIVRGKAIVSEQMFGGLAMVRGSRRSSGRGDGRRLTRPRSKKQEPVERCPNPKYHNTDPSYVRPLPVHAKQWASDDIKERIRQNIWEVRHCRYCGVVFLIDPELPAVRIGYFEPPGIVPTAQSDGWHPYPPDLTAPSD